MNDTGPIILFDVMCVLCSANAQFILRHDRHRRFRLASIQGEVGQKLCRRHGIDPDDPDTIIVVTGDHALRDSDAVLAIYAGLGWPWRSTSALRVVPASSAIRSIGSSRATVTGCSGNGRSAGDRRPKTQDG